MAGVRAQRAQPSVVKQTRERFGRRRKRMATRQERGAPIGKLRRLFATSRARDSYRLPLLSSSRGSAAAKIAAVASTISTPTESGKNGAKTSSSEVQKASVFVPRTAGEVVDRVNARSTNAAGETLWRQLTLIPPIFMNRLSSNQC